MFTFGLLRWSIFICIIELIKPEHNTPVLLMSTFKNNIITSRCIADENYSNKALSIFSDKYKAVRDVHSYYLPNHNSSALNCNFETDNCYYEVNRFRYMNSEYEFFTPITDERWEDFEELVSNNTYVYTGVHTYSKFSFSVRGNEDLYVAVCDENYIASSTTCYLFVIDERNSENGIITGFKKCSKNKPTESSLKCTKLLVGENRKLLKTKAWNTFTIYIKTFDGGVTFSFSNIHKQLFSFTDKNPATTGHVLVKSTESAVWKFHRTQFLITREAGSFIKSTVLYPPKSGMCIAFYTSMCSICNIDIFVNVLKWNSQTFIQSIYSEEETIKWSQKKIKIHFDPEYSYGIEIIFKTDVNTRTRNVYWAVDDIRECSIEEKRIVEVTSELDEYNCQVVEEESVIKASSPKEPYPCPNGILGKECSLKCSDIVGIDFCNNTIVCSDSNCFCPSGFYGNKCEKVCAGVYHDSKDFCRHRCNENCDSERCNIFKGVCDKCKFGYQLPNCDTFLNAIVTTQLDIVDFSYNYINVRFTFAFDEHSNEISHYSIQYKNWNDMNPKWIQDITPEIYEFGEERTIKIFPLLPGTRYGIRAIFYRSNQINSNESLPYINETTSCEELTFGEITDIEESNKITINIPFIINEHNCNHYSLFVNSEEVKFFNKSFAYKNDLPPYTNVIISLINKITDKKIDKNYMTQEGVSSPITNMFYNETDTQIYLKWDPPEHPNGKILHYLVGYELYRLKGCKNYITPNETKNFTTVDTSYTIKNLRPYSVYKIYVIPMSSKSGAFKYEITHTLETDVPDEPLEKSPDMHVSETYATIKWRLPSDCKIIKGSIQYNIRLLEHNVWNTTEKTFSVNSNDITEYKIEKLIPYTNYTVFIYTKRPDNPPNDVPALEYTFTTKPTKPPAVSMFEAYGQSADAIYLRWKRPFPPNGILESYYLSHDCGFTCRTYQFFIPANSYCEAWEEYACYTIKGLSEEFNYKIRITPKNIGTEYGDARQITITAQLSKPSKPENASAYFNLMNSSLTVTWHHPLYNSPINEFFCSICKQGSTKDCPKKILKLTTIKKEYSLMFTDVMSANTYDVRINSKNFYYEGDETMFEMITNPPIPQFETYPSFKEITNTSIIVYVPSKSSRYTYDNTTLLISVLIQDNLNSMEEIRDDNNITVELKPTWSGFYFTFGNEATDFPLNTSLNDIKIINISFILISHYKNKTSQNVYFIYKSEFVDWSKVIEVEPNEQNNNSGYYTLLLILFIIPVVILLLRKKNSRTSKITNNIPMVHKTRHSESSRMISETPSDDLKVTERMSKILIVPHASNIERNQREEVIPSVSKTCVTISKLKDYVKTAMETNILEEQHKSFPKGQTKPWDCGFTTENKAKNRYGNVIAYDETRVVLKKIRKDPFSDYINANYIDGYQTKKAYIATQGPKEKTLNDFWRMVWQEESKYIVMLCNVSEGGKKKCEQYWPPVNETKQFGNIKVFHLNTQVFATYVSRSLKITCEKTSRTITQFHFTSWPDHGIPLYPKSLMPLLKRIVVIPPGPPIIVHCSAGVGRTGTILLCDICLRMAAGEGAVDVFKYLGYLREQRANMVDNKDQYLLVHLVLVECLLVEPTSIICDDDLEYQINNLISSNGIRKQMDMIDEYAWMDKVIRPSTELNPLNQWKNRFEHITAGYGRVIISKYPQEDQSSDYINAVFVNGYKQKDQFIVTQQPLPNTLSDFWRMIDEKGICIIVSVNVLNFDDETLIPVYPDVSFDLNPLPYLTVKHVNTVDTEYYDLITVNLFNTQSKEYNQRVINIIQCKSWDADSILPSGDIMNLINLWEMVEKMSKENSPIVVTCYSGVTASGLFVTLAFLIEKIKLEQDCDVCLAVRTVRHNRQEFLRHKEQFEFLYKAAVTYVQSFQFYSNFKVCLHKK